MTEVESRDTEDPYAGVDLIPELCRVRNPWLQILRDMTAPAPMSHWAAEVTSRRILRYDRVRPFATRGAFLVAAAIFLSAAPDTWWLTWALLIPSSVQVVLEILLEPLVGAADVPGGSVMKSLAAIAESAHAKTLINVTGMIGAVAVPCNIVAVAYLSGPGQPTWPKVLALAAAAAYGVSAMMSFLADATHYSANQSPGRGHRAFRAVRPHVWLVITVVMTAMVAGSIAAGRWAPEMVPLAWALCAVPVLIGTRQRDYERVLRASAEQLPEVQAGAKRALSKDYHNAYTDIRTFNRELSVDDSVSAGIRVRAASLAPLISLMAEAIDREQWIRQQQRASLPGIAAKHASDAGLTLTADIRLDDLQPHNYEVARALISALLVNVGQAAASIRNALAKRKEQVPDFPVTVVGEIRAGFVCIGVRDSLPPIADWCRAGSTTEWLHADLLGHGSRDGLTQHPIDVADPTQGKEIRASWPVKKPPTDLRGLRR